MKHFGAVIGDGGFEKDPPPLNQFVIPDIPMQDHTSFLSVPGFKKCTLAKVCNSNIDPDKILILLADYFKGLPKSLLNHMLVETLVAASKVPANQLYRVYVTTSSARIQSVRNDALLCTLWDNFDPSKFA